jgi:hypothetical protein
MTHAFHRKRGKFKPSNARLWAEELATKPDVTLRQAALPSLSSLSIAA